MIAAITLLADAFHQTASGFVTRRQRLRVVAARLVEGGEDPAPLFPQDVDLDCALVSLGIGEQADALRLLLCRPRAGSGRDAASLVVPMANAVAMQVIAWSGASIGFASVVAPTGRWPLVLGEAAHGIRVPATGIGVVVAEVGDSRLPVVAALIGDGNAGIAQWVPTAVIRGV